MADDVMDRLRSADPLPDGSTAPAFELIYAQVDTTADSGRRGRGRRQGIGLLLPALTIAVTLTVIAVVVVVLVGSPAGTDQSTHGPLALTTPLEGTTTTPEGPEGGMPGRVSVWGATFNAGGDGVISLQQSRTVRQAGSNTTTQLYQDWLLSTRDGGLSWALSPEDYYLTSPAVVGRSGWSVGLQVLTKAESVREHLTAAWEPGSGTVLFFASSNAGAGWRVARASFYPYGYGAVSLRAGEVWTSATGPYTNIVHGQAGSGRLTPTSAQPVYGRYDTDVHVVGAGPGLAYVVNAAEPRLAYVTRNDGASWTAMTAPPCPGENPSVDLDDAQGQTVWLTCSAGPASHQTARLLRSTNAGRSWQALAQPWGADYAQFTAVSPNTAWALTSAGELWRTTDAGGRWTTVWSLAETNEHPLSGPISEPIEGELPILSVQSADSARIVTLLNRHRAPSAAKLTNLVVYRTDDGGSSWRTNVVPLVRHTH